MPRYFALVRNVHNKDRINWKRSGELWAQRFRDAIDEAKAYQMQINHGYPEEFTPKADPWYLVVPTVYSDLVTLIAKKKGSRAAAVSYIWRNLHYKRVMPQPTLLEAMNRRLSLVGLDIDPE